ncbi:MAG: hypothetical protein GY853_13305 [PVC group bacterium]|nr:hypothetical protein [PVC group bacterium]
MPKPRDMDFSPEDKGFFYQQIVQIFEADFNEPFINYLKELRITVDEKFHKSKTAEDFNKYRGQCAIIDEILDVYPKAIKELDDYLHGED